MSAPGLRRSAHLLRSCPSAFKSWEQGGQSSRPAGFSTFPGALALFAGLALKGVTLGFASFGSSSLFAGSRSQKLWRLFLVKASYFDPLTWLGDGCGFLWILFLMGFLRTRLASSAPGLRLDLRTSRQVAPDGIDGLAIQGPRSASRDIDF